MPGVFLLAPGPVFQDPNAQAVHANATVTSNGSAVLVGYGVKEISLVINVKNAPTGTLPTLQYTIQEVDPGDSATVLGVSTTSVVFAGVGIQIITLPTTLIGYLKISWAVGGSTPSFTGVYATVVGKATTVSTGLDSTGTQQPVRVDASGRPQVLLYDGLGNPVLVSSDGAFQISVSDDASRDLLKEVLTELKKMTTHLAYMTDLDIHAGDVE